MKNKEEPSTDSTRGSYGSLSRPGRTAAASVEQPALSLFPESLMEALVDPANMQLAWQQVRSNRGAGTAAQRWSGPDGITLAAFPEWVASRWPTIRQQLLDGAYRPEPVRRVTIVKPDGGARLLGQCSPGNGQTCSTASSSKPSCKSSRRCSIQASRNRATAFDPSVPLTEQPSKYSKRSAEATALPWTWICRNSSTESNTTS